MLIGLYIRPSLKHDKQRLNLLLNSNWQFLAKIKAVSFSFCFPLFQELLFFILVVVDTIYGIEVVSFPVSLSSFSLHDFIVSLNFNIIVYNVLVCNDIVLSGIVLLLVFIFFSLLHCYIRNNLRVGLEEGVFLEVGSGVPACRCWR